MSDIPIHAHLVGIKGVAMAALAVYLSEKGIRVTGSDVSDTFPTEEELSRAGIAVLIGFSPSHITDDIPDVVYYGCPSGERKS